MNSPSSHDDRDIEVNVVSEPNSPEPPNKFRSVNILIAPNSPQNVAQNYTINGGRKSPIFIPKSQTEGNSLSKFRNTSNSDLTGFRSSSPNYGTESKTDQLKIVTKATSFKIKDVCDLSPVGTRDKESSIEKHSIEKHIGSNNKMKEDISKDTNMTQNSPKMGGGQTSGYTSFSISSILSRSEPRKQGFQGSTPRTGSPPRAVLEAAALAAHHLQCSDAAMLSR